MSILLAFFPMSAIAGATNPTMSNGIVKPRNSLKIELKVMNMRDSHAGNTYPAPIPRAIAIIMRPSKPIFSLLIFIVGVVRVYYCGEKQKSPIYLRPKIRNYSLDDKIM